MITYSDWLEWRKLPITQLFYEVCRERIEEAKEAAINQCGLDHSQDNFYRGFVYAFREMLEFKVEPEDLERGNLQ